jgi:lysyl endopeptidase
MNMRTVLFLCTPLLLSAAALHAQPPLLQLSPPDIQAKLALDAASTGPQPFRFAVPVPVNVTPATHGAWDSLPDGRQRWRLQVTSAGANSLNFAFTRFELPQGASLTIASADGRDVRGPYGPEDSAQGQLWTPIVRGNTALLELLLPAGAPDAVDLRLTAVNHGFRGFGLKTDPAFKSGACNVDVVCPLGDPWRDEIRSVARIVISGLFACTGSMLNNTSGDFTPLFLTANHCVATHAQALTTVFYWNFETSTCGGTPDGRLDQNQTGATLLATSTQSDFTLMQLVQPPSPEFGVFYAGWDRRDVAWSNVTGIHHPAADEKRISFYFGQTDITAQFAEPDDPDSQLNPAYLKVRDWDIGTTEGGSSGSGLWNANRHLVGQLSGGSAACSSENPSQGNGLPDWYGRMHTNWEGLATPLTSVATWLDPLGTGAEFVNGAEPSDNVTPDAPGATPERRSSGGGFGWAVLTVLLLAAQRRRRQS